MINRLKLTWMKYSPIPKDPFHKSLDLNRDFVSKLSDNQVSDYYYLLYKRRELANQGLSNIPCHKIRWS